MESKKLIADRWSLTKSNSEMRILFHWISNYDDTINWNKNLHRLFCLFSALSINAQHLAHSYLQWRFPTNHMLYRKERNENTHYYLLILRNKNKNLIGENLLKKKEAFPLKSQILESNHTGDTLCFMTLLLHYSYILVIWYYLLSLIYLCLRQSSASSISCFMSQFCNNNNFIANATFMYYKKRAVANFFIVIIKS